jgi:BMFP domain-containing protein YqiC
MPATSSRFFDELAKLMTNAAGAASGVRKEVDSLVQTQVERVREMAEKARMENDKLATRIAELESKLKASN